MATPGWATLGWGMSGPGAADADADADADVDADPDPRPWWTLDAADVEDSVLLDDTDLASMSDVVLDCDGLPVVPPQPSTYTPHFWFQKAVSESIRAMRIKDKRKIYYAMRQPPDVTPDSFLCPHGVSVAEFATWQVLNDRPRRSTSGSMVSMDADRD